MSASPAVRGLRAAVFAAVCVTLAAAGHALATAGTPPPGAVGAGFLAVFAAGWLLGARERSLPGIGAATLAGQAGLHLLFGAARPRIPTQPQAPSTTPTTTHDPHPYAHGPHPYAHLVPAPARHPHAHLVTATAPHPHPALAMTPHATAAHVLAALAVSWWLRRGEAALWSLLRRAAALLPGLVAWWRDGPAPSPVARAVRPGHAPDASSCRLLLRHAVSRRGPPAPIPYPNRPRPPLLRTEITHPCP
ncbi:hypothetical protein [Streptomyces phaeofaciens]|uniref:hypothetical protein n=1 Tax=Streptomyces phaeofaciens TaxID=68254 RepID=UPI0036C8F118